MRIARVVFGVVAVGCVGLAAYAEPVVKPRPPTHAEAVARVGKLHAVVMEVHAMLQRARGAKNAADDDGVVALDTTTGGASYNVNCAGGGTTKLTVSTSVTSAGSASGAGSASVSATFTNCVGSGSSDTLGGNITYTYSTTGTTTTDGGKSTSATVTYTYTGGTLKVVGPNAGTYGPAGLSVTTVQPPSTGAPPQTTANGTVAIDGTAVTFANETFSVSPK